MKLANPFTNETRHLWLGWWICTICGGNGMNRGGLELHHITGRDSNSPLNGAVLCGVCHSHMVHTAEEEIWLFTKVLKMLWHKRYKLVQNDFDFMESHPYLVINNKELEKWLT